MRGVTLVELIAVLVIVGVVASIGAKLMVTPVQSLMSGATYTQLAEHTAQGTRRLEDDLGTALANSIRVTAGSAATGSASFLELVPVQAVGRYRKRAPGDPLDFENPADTSFDVLGPIDAFPANAALVIHNLGTDEANVYLGNNRRPGATLSGSQLSFTGNGSSFPVDSPSGRFAIVGNPITWVCRPAADGSGTLERVTGYTIDAQQPSDDASAPLATGQRFVAVRGVVGCAFTYEPAQANLGLVRLSLELASGETRTRVALQYALENTP
jgi:MSHA biogenesis protein MshO